VSFDVVERPRGRLVDHLGGLPRGLWTELRSSRAFGRQLAMSSALLIMATLITGLLGYVYWTLAARSFDARTVGYAAALVAAMTMVSAVGGLGAGHGMAYILPHAGERWGVIVSSALATVAAVSTALALAFAGIAALLGIQLGELVESPTNLVMFVGVCVLWSVSLVMDDILTVERCANLLLFRHAFAAVVRVIAVPIILSLWGEAGGFPLFAVWGVSAFCSCLPAIILFFRFSPQGRECSLGWDVEAVRQVLPLALKNHGYVMMAMAPYLLIPILVSNVLSLEANAYYYTTWMITYQVYTIINSTNVALFAHGASAGELDRRQLNRVLLALFAVVVPAVVLLIIVGRIALSILGPGYLENGASLLIWLALVALPKTITELYATVMRIRQRFQSAFRLVSGASIGTLVLAAVFLRIWGLPAIGIAYLVCFSVAAVYCIYDLWLRTGSAGATPASGPRPSEAA
jgi:O-antigen/teichoic acid export membrane protein